MERTPPPSCPGGKNTRHGCVFVRAVLGLMSRHAGGCSSIDRYAFMQHRLASSRLGVLQPRKWALLFLWCSSRSIQKYLQTFIFNLRAFTQIWHLLLRNYNLFNLSTFIFRVQMYYIFNAWIKILLQSMTAEVWSPWFTRFWVLSLKMLLWVLFSCWIMVCLVIRQLLAIEAIFKLLAFKKSWNVFRFIIHLLIQEACFVFSSSTDH